jgi:hypothetical protein
MDGRDMAEVFISYKREERPRIEPFATRLLELGVDVWFDNAIPPGKDFGETIYARLREAKAVLVCWSAEAIQSNWVRNEADYALEERNYIPVLVAPCKLVPPFRLIETANLSHWTGEATDPIWIKVLDRIAELIGRPGVAAAARAFATGDEQTLYDFARRYSDEPTACKIWNTAEARHREHFAGRMTEAKRAAEERNNKERMAFDARLRDAGLAFEVWLADEQHAAAKGPMPDPLGLVERADVGESRRLREEIAALHSALALTEADQKDLNAAKSEIAKLTEELTTVRGSLLRANASERELHTGKTNVDRRSDELANAPTHEKDIVGNPAAENRLIAQLAPSDGVGIGREASAPQNTITRNHDDSRVELVSAQSNKATSNISNLNETLAAKRSLKVAFIAWASSWLLRTPVAIAGTVCVGVAVVGAIFYATLPQSYLYNLSGWIGIERACKAHTTYNTTIIDYLYYSLYCSKVGLYLFITIVTVGLMMIWWSSRPSGNKIYHNTLR